MRVDKKLNLVVPIYDEEEVPVLDKKTGEPLKNADGTPVTEQPIVAYVHSTPLPAEVVDRYFMILAQTFARIFSQGLGTVGGPAVALRVLRETATNLGAWDDDPKSGTIGVEHGLVEEIRRLSNVLVKGADGWHSLPLAIAAQQGHLNEDDVREVENAIVFFTVGSAMLPRAVRRTMLGGAAGLWAAQLSPLTSTEWRDSLRTSTAAASTGEKRPADVNEKKPAAAATKDGKPVSVPA